MVRVEPRSGLYSQCPVGERGGLDFIPAGLWSGVRVNLSSAVSPSAAASRTFIWPGSRLRRCEGACSRGSVEDDELQVDPMFSINCSVYLELGRLLAGQGQRRGIGIIMSRDVMLKIHVELTR